MPICDPDQGFRVRGNKGSHGVLQRGRYCPENVCADGRWQVAMVQVAVVQVTVVQVAVVQVAAVQVAVVQVTAVHVAVVQVAVVHVAVVTSSNDSALPMYLCPLS